MDPRIRIRLLERGDRRDHFRSGEPVLDTFLSRYAGQNQFRSHVAVTYVAVEERTREVLGYVTVTAGSLGADEHPTLAEREVPYGRVPILRMARLAVDTRVQGQGLGELLLLYVLRLAIWQSEAVGCTGVVIDAKPDAVGYYERFGFRTYHPLRGGGATRPRLTNMFLSIAKVKDAMQGIDRP